MIKSATKNIFRPMQPSDFKNVYLVISKQQVKDVPQLIIDNDLKNIVEFETSFCISTLFLAKGTLKTRSTIITTELIESKAKKALENFKKAAAN